MCLPLPVSQFTEGVIIASSRSWLAAVASQRVVGGSGNSLMELMYCISVMHYRRAGKMNRNFRENITNYLFKIKNYVCVHHGCGACLSKPSLRVTRPGDCDPPGTAAHCPWSMTVQQATAIGFSSRSNSSNLRTHSVYRLPPAAYVSECSSGPLIRGACENQSPG